MKIGPYIHKLNNSKEYQEFQKKYSDAFMIAGFFILDLEMKKNIHQIDFYVPSEKKIAAFTLDKGVSVQLLEMMNSEKVPRKLDIETKVDLDAIEGIVRDEMKNRNMTENIQKIIAIIQNIDGKKVWNVNCILSGMGILKAHIEDESRSVLRMDKSSILDIVKKVPAEELAKMKQGQAMKNKQESKEDIKQKIDKLNKLEEEIEKQKKSLEKEVSVKKEKSSKSSKK